MMLRRCWRIAGTLSSETTASNRPFSHSAQVWKKRAGASSDSGEDLSLDAAKVRELMESSVKMFEDKIKEIKAGQRTTDKFANLMVGLSHGNSQPLKSLAAVASRGNNINIVAFDPKQVKYIKTAIVSQLNMAADQSKTDSQTISVSLPPASQAKKAEQEKDIKEAFEFFRNNLKNRHSLAGIRQKYLAPLKKAAEAKSGVSKDHVKKLTTELESITKTHQLKLQSLIK